MTYLDSYPSPLGEIVLASDGKAITGLWLSGQKLFGTTITKETKETQLPIFEETKRWLDVYFSGKNPGQIPSVSFDGGSLFQKEVWNILLAIPYGKTMTYGEIAKQIESKTGKWASAQAVGGAVGHNPISILVPCHRVMGAKGNLTGYAGGIERKIVLLKIEGIDVSSFQLPKAQSKIDVRGRRD